MEDQAYLDPDFDPTTLTVPRLRSILVAHNVNYPSSAKKPELIQIFKDNVASQARKIQAASARVKRTSRGIVDVTTGRHGTGAGDYETNEDDETPMAPTPATGRSSRRTTRARTEEAQEVGFTPRSTRYSTAPPEATPSYATSKHARTETIAEESVPKRAASRKRISATTPGAKVDVTEDDSPFSKDNVFQTGSSPPPPTRESDRRRTATSSTARDLDRRHRELRRQTDQDRPVRPQVDNAVVPSRRTFEFPMQRRIRDEIETSEEFTPEGQLEVVQAEQAGELVPARSRTRRPAHGVPQAVGVILFALFTGLAAMYRQEKLNVGYCGLGEASTDIAGAQVPEWAEFMRPQCEPCPPHAYCHEQLRTECESGFVLQHSIPWLGDILPIPPTCQPDSARARKVNAVKERAVEQLRQANAKYECGEAARPDVKETALKQAISTARRKGMSNEEFEDLWAAAIGEITDVDEVVSGSDGSGHATLRSKSLAAVPFSCAVRRSLRETLRQYFWQLVVVLAVLSSGSYGRYRIASGRETETRAKQLAGMALEKLNVQATLHAREPDIYRENYVSVAQLRDDVLREEFSATRRKKLWEKVQKKVESNANVRPMVREGRTGDVGRVWEWVGAVGLLESPPQTGDRRKSARVSFAPEDGFMEASESDISGTALQRSDTGVRKKWEESRSYY